MQMTKDEIIRSYKEAKHKALQIGVLADLNACSRERIRNILTEAGVMEKTTEKERTKKESGKNEQARVVIPQAVYERLEKDMDELEAEINKVSQKKAELEKAYGEIADFFKNCMAK